MSQDPARWSSSAGELSGEYEAAIVAFRAQGPSEAQLSRMLDGLEDSAPALLSTKVWLGWKLGLACLVGAALLGALTVWPRAQRIPASHAVQAPMASQVVVPAQAASAPPQVEVEAPSQVEPALPAPPASQLARPKQVRRHVVPVALAASSSPAPSVQDPLAELALLQRARRVLAQQPARTLALAQEHLQHFPRGAFSEERELLAIEALAALSQRAEAERRARAFRQQFARSIHLKRVAELIER
jgi:hypothetical protein